MAGSRFSPLLDMSAAIGPPLPPLIPIWSRDVHTPPQPASRLRRHWRDPQFDRPGDDGAVRTPLDRSASLEPDPDTLPAAPRAGRPAGGAGSGSVEPGGQG